jgi:hypothetical protein
MPYITTNKTILKFSLSFESYLPEVSAGYSEVGVLTSLDVV